MNSAYYIAMLIVVIIILILYSLFPLYDKVNPTIAGLPMFYWYQILMLGVTTVISFLVAYFVKEEGEKK
ncbi:DUF3311 domain-containing protein [Sulfurisphaera javensis]|uniref:DUF3311 domain-containing protein n=1 Tax=Sulfurisphaera javensis TaxID=2049879 RepID=A0AAT9GSM3_9CREN